MTPKVLLPRGKYFEYVRNLLLEAGFEFTVSESRSYSFTSDSPFRVEFVQARMRDIPFLMRERGMDAGFVGDEWVKETSCEGFLIRLVETSAYQARIVIVARKGHEPDLEPRDSSRPFEVFTKYPTLAHKSMAQHSAPFKIIQVSGAAEGLITREKQLGVICVETGQTMRDHQLVEISEVTGAALALYAAPWSLRNEGKSAKLKQLSEKVTQKLLEVVDQGEAI